MKITILYPFLVYAEYEDGYEGYFGGQNEYDAVCEALYAIDKHGDCTFYTGVTGEYNGRWYMDGELMPPDPFYDN